MNHGPVPSVRIGNAGSCLKHRKRFVEHADPEIDRAANKLIEQHGEDAPIQAAMRHDELLEKGDMEGATVWKRILRAIDELLSEERPEGAKVH